MDKHREENANCKCWRFVKPFFSSLCKTIILGRFVCHYFASTSAVCYNEAKRDK
jgi:hypothetical protein